ncbi:MAG: hypothetical protein IAF02_15705 [Anaerolineae bacterium]|nr:hypothetical protein [Anaerolineae bacterium]
MNNYFIHKIRANGGYGTSYMQGESLDDIPVGNNIPDDVIITIVEFDDDDLYWGEELLSRPLYSL